MSPKDKSSTDLDAAVATATEPKTIVVDATAADAKEAPAPEPIEEEKKAKVVADAKQKVADAKAALAEAEAAHKEAEEAARPKAVVGKHVLLEQSHGVHVPVDIPKEWLDDKGVPTYQRVLRYGGQNHEHVTENADGIWVYRRM